MKRKTIRNHKDFKASLYSLSVRTHAFVVRAEKTKINNEPRYGLVVPKRTMKLATQRNRAKRLIRDWISFNENLMSPQLDYLFFVKAEILQCNRDYGRRRVKWALKRIRKLYNKNNEK